MHSGIERVVAFIGIAVLLVLAGCDQSRSLGPDATLAAGGAGNLSPPTGLTATAASPSRITLAWKDNSPNETGYEVHRSTAGPAGPFTGLVTTVAGAVSYDDAGLVARTQYCYEVRMYRVTGNKTTYSAFSSIACATTPAAPAAPTGLTASAVSSTRIDLAWNDNSTAETGFSIERCQGDGCTSFAVVADVAANTAAWTNDGLPANTVFSFRVRARADDSYSGYSNIAAATTQSTPPSAHLHMTVTTTTTGTDLDPDGYTVQVWKYRDWSYIYLNGAVAPANGSVSIDLEANPYIVLTWAGELVVQLGGVAANCNVTSPNPVSQAMSSAPQAAFTIACSPDTRLAVVDGADGNAEIYAVNANGGNRTRLTIDPAADVDPAWSRDGGRIAFASERDGDREIYVMNADGSNAQRLTSSPGTDGTPSWSPDGTRIAFASERDGNGEIYVMSADGSDAVNLSSHAATDDDPAWSPDGRIAFRSDRGGESSIYVMNADGSGIMQLTFAAGDEADSQPAWSPDGTQIAFTRWWCNFESGCKSDILVVSANGSGYGWLTVADGFSGETHNHPTWSPDGHKVAFASNLTGVGFILADGSGGLGLGEGVAHITEGSAPAWRW